MRLTSFFARSTIARRVLVVAGTLLLAAAPLGAQDPVPPKIGSDYVVPFSTAYLLAGRLNADPSMINAHFARPDLPTGTGFSALSNDAYAIGLGGYFPVSRVLFGFEAYYADLGYETSPAGKTNDGEMAYAMAMVGLPVYTSWRFTVFPYLGLGAGTMRVTLKNRDGGPTVSLAKSPTFDEIVLNPGTDSQVLGNYIMVQPGFGVDYLVLKDDNSSRLGLTVGIRFGSAITPNRTQWKYRGHEVFGGPTFQPSGTTLRILVGIGGFRMAK